MCGINGLVSEKLTIGEKTAIVQKMNATLSHRGPDHDGVWNNERVFFGHRRLSIIDLSPECNQPFFSNDKRYTIIYNGELYNYRELKLELQRATHGSDQAPYFFKTNSDTEVVLAAYIRWGTTCLDLFNGMFAFAIYDGLHNKLFIARDRMGVKPLYYYHGAEGFIFSSEIRPLIHSGVKAFSLNREAVGEYVMYQTVFAPNTIVKDIKMLMPGHFMEYHDEQLSVSQYYSLNAISNQPDKLSYKEICEKTNELLSLSVQRRLIADVPFGAFLSGGIDSSAIVGLMSRVSSEKVQTFNVSFYESEFSESTYARMVAKKFNTNHHEIRLSPGDFLNQLPEALAAMDHPSGDGPNTYVVSKATKNAGITMALSGIGGDELFAGYDVFKRMSSLQNKSWLNVLPLPFRQLMSLLIQTANSSVGANKVAELLKSADINFESAYVLSRSLFTQKEISALLKEPSARAQIHRIISKVPQIKDHLLSAVSIAEMNTYLQNTLLRDTDQMSMAVALEVREPFLDNKLIEFVLGVNDQYKFPLTPKKLLTDSLGDLLPDEIVNRPKMGFTFPWQNWLKHELKSFCEKNIFEFAEHGFSNKKSVQELWKRFLAGDRSVTWSRIWHLVVLNNWLKENKIESN